MQLYLIRHAQSENNALYARTGSFEGRKPDPGLSDVGHIQAERLASFLDRGDHLAKTDEHDAYNRRGFELTHIYCSLLRRSIETALPISRKLGIPAAAHCDLHEWGGMFELVGETPEFRGLAGPNRDFFEEQYPELLLPDALGREGWWNRPHESREEAFERAAHFFEELKTKHGAGEDNIALVTHAGFYHSLLSIITDLPLDPTNEAWNTRVLFAMNNVAISRISFREKGTVVVYLNRLDFLPPELVT